MSLDAKQVADLDSYAELSGITRDELIRRAVALFFDELREDEDWREIYERRGFLGYRDEACRSDALPQTHCLRISGFRFRLAAVNRENSPAPASSPWES